jgi:hypothetical protein
MGPCIRYTRLPEGPGRAERNLAFPRTFGRPRHPVIRLASGLLISAIGR